VPGTTRTTQINEQNSRDFYRRWVDYVSNRAWNVLLGGDAAVARTAAEPRNGRS
jgi:hypothetical protein